KEHDTQIPLLDAEHEQWKTDRERQRDEELRQIEESYQKGLVELQTRTERENQEAKETMQTRVRDAQRWHDEERTSCQKRWEQERDRLRNELRESTEADRHLFPAWDDPVWQNWQPPDTAPPVLRFGNVQVDLEKYPGGSADDPNEL